MTTTALSSALSQLSCLGVLFSIYVISLGVYRLVFSPIAHFPGSKITALSGWYETYLDVYKGGQFTFQIEKWHQRYGRRLPRVCL